MHLEAVKSKNFTRCLGVVRAECVGSWLIAIRVRLQNNKKQVCYLAALHDGDWYACDGVRLVLLLVIVVIVGVRISYASNRIVFWYFQRYMRAMQTDLCGKN